MPPPYPDTKQGDDGHPHIGYCPNGYPPQEDSPLLGTQVCIIQILFNYQILTVPNTTMIEYVEFTESS